MANYHLIVNAQMSDEWAKKFEAFLDELKQAGYEVLNESIDATEDEAVAILEIAKQSGISLYLQRK